MTQEYGRIISGPRKYLSTEANKKGAPKGSPCYLLLGPLGLLSQAVARALAKVDRQPVPTPEGDQAVGASVWPVVLGGFHVDHCTRFYVEVNPSEPET